MRSAPQRASVALALLIALAPKAFAQTSDQPSIKLQTRDCVTPPADMIARLPPVWQSWQGYISICPVRSPAGKIALRVLSVRIDLYETEHPNAADLPDHVPPAQLRTLSNEEVGELQTALQKGFPSRSTTYFSNWQNGLPHRIDVLHENDAAFGTHWDYPLIWNPKSNRYEPKK